MQRLVRPRASCADLRKPRGILFAHAPKIKEGFFCFCAFVHALRERAIFGAVEFDNRTFEGESLFNSYTGPQ